jgi:glyoxylase-like metal-dependent hydrolase (beta-lactamase superfamily II)/ferredoxin
VADPARRREENVPGPFFVDTTCIDCDTCRWVAPESFSAVGDQAAGTLQPRTIAEEEAALKALVACPTGSIGADLPAARVKEGMALFPDPIAPAVYHLGFHARSSFGAASYLLTRRDGNVMVDSPRYNAGLAERVEALGEVKYLYLTHRDDVADHAKWAERLGCKRVLHRDDVTRGTAEVEIQPAGEDEFALAPDLTVIPVPGHTRGHSVLHAGPYLFTGDHLAYSPRRGRLVAFRDACWYDWGEQTRSMARLLDRAFEWVLPGHGRRHHAAPAEMRHLLEDLIAWMRRVA